MKAAARAVRRGARAGLQAAGSGLLAVPPARAALNVAYDAMPRRGRALFVRCFLGSRIRRPFLWRVTFPGGAVRIPVSADLPQSWGMALGVLSAEPALFRLYEAVIALPRGERVFFDVGSNHGIHALRFLAADYRCALFEPQTQCNRFVREVARVNGWQPWIEECALSTAEGDADFFVSPTTWFSSFSRVHVERFEPARAVRVRTRTLDSFCRASGLRPGLLKIDVEGHELEVLEGGKESVERLRPLLVVELLPGAPAKRALFGWLGGLGYRIAAVEPQGLVPVESAEALEACPFEDFLFCPDPGLLLTLDRAFGTGPSRRSAACPWTQ
jgi:FkbM family methyltransferase